MFGFIKNKRRREIHVSPIPLVPQHWIDTTPVESKDKPCALSALDLNVRVSGLYADVTETLVISNPNKRDLSVALTIPLPDRAVVCGYALDIDGQMIDGVVVPKEKARVAFETEQRRGADPGLVEAVKGNVYQTRVYPVPASKSRTVKLRYTTPLVIEGGQAAYLDAPMPAEHLDKRTIRIDVELLDCPTPELSGVNDASFKELGTCWSVESTEQNLTPNAHVRVALPQLPSSFALVERDDEGTVWFAASERASRATDNDAPPIETLTVLWDTSGSRADIDHEPACALLRAYGAAGAISSFRLIAFSDHAEPLLTFKTIDDLLKHLSTLPYDGGSDFQELSRALADVPTGAHDACVLFTDGLDTLSGEPLSLPMEHRVLAVVSGAQRDAESLRQACRGLAFDLATAPKDAAALAQALFCSQLLSSVAGEGIAEVLGIGSGGDGRYAVIGKLTAASTNISFGTTGTSFTLDAAQAREGSTISHAWAALRVSQLSPRSDDNADELLALGIRFGVVSPATSLLVLETLDQWLRYDIEPPKTWETMHKQWEQRQQGMMNLSSEQELEDNHLNDLKRSWTDLKNWWERDYTASAEPTPESPGFCRACGSRLMPDARFCPRCGTPVARMDATAYMGGSAGNAVYAASAIYDAAPQADASAMMISERRMASASMPNSVTLAEEVVDADDLASPSEPSPAAASVNVQAWMPDAPYLKALDEALGNGIEAAHVAYLEQRAPHATSPSFFIDCAGWFMTHDDRAFGLHVLTNLAELRIEDAALLRVMAWRMREADDLERALVILRRVLKLRSEDSQSHRDIALVLDELARKSLSAGNEDAARQHAEEAASFYRTIALTPWQRRRRAIGLFAVEEYNVLRAWADAQTWKTTPQLEPIDAELEGVFDCDLRITLAWDADETDIDLHVTEPTGEEAYYGNRLTHIGGRVSEDITDGYGPELYEIRHAREGAYAIRAHYYASHQQTVFGPASCTLTIYTDWGRPTQKQTITSTRLESEHEMNPVGTAFYGEAANQNEPTSAPDEHGDKQAITKGAAVSALIEAYGTPAQGDSGLVDGELVWELSGDRVLVATIVAGKAERVVERMPWGEELVIVQ